MGRVIIAAVAVGLLTAGCSGGQQATAPPPSPQAPNATTAASSKPLLVKLGESFSIDDPSGVPAGTVMFTSAEVDPSSCPAPSDYDKQYGTPMPAGHHLVTVSAVIETTAAVSATNLPPLHDGDFAEVGADGFTNTNLSPANYGFANKCVPEREKVTAGVLSPNSKYKDREVLEVSSSNGTLIYQPRFTADHPQPHSITFPQAPVPAPTSSVVPTTAPPTTTAAERAVPTATPAARSSTTPRTSKPAPAIPSCPPGTVFSPMGVEPCQTPAQVAQIERGERLCGPGNGPVDVCGPKPTPDPRFYNPDGTPRSSGDIQTENGCKAGYITGPACAKYR